MSDEPSQSNAKPRKKISVMVDAAFKSMNQKSGSSLFAIRKYLSESYSMDADSARSKSLIKKYIKDGVESGKFIQTKGTNMSGSFRLSSKALKKFESKSSAPKKKPKPKENAEGSKSMKPKAPRKKKDESDSKTKSIKPKTSAALKIVVPKASTSKKATSSAEGPKKKVVRKKTTATDGAPKKKVVRKKTTASDGAPKKKETKRKSTASDTKKRSVSSTKVNSTKKSPAKKKATSTAKSKKKVVSPKAAKTKKKPTRKSPSCDSGYCGIKDSMSEWEDEDDGFMCTTGTYGIKKKRKSIATLIKSGRPKFGRK